MDLVARHGRPVVVEFGLWATPQNIALLGRMRDAGADPWFFHGDRTAANEAWRRENRIRPRNFENGKWDEVVQKVDDNWGLIVDAVGEHRMLRTIEAAERMLAAGNVSGELLNWIALLGVVGQRRPVFLEPQRSHGHAYGVWRWD